MKLTSIKIPTCNVPYEKIVIYVNINRNQLLFFNVDELEFHGNDIILDDAFHHVDIETHYFYSLNMFLYQWCTECPNLAIYKQLNSVKLWNTKRFSNVYSNFIKINDNECELIFYLSFASAYIPLPIDYTLSSIIIQHHILHTARNTSKSIMNAFNTPTSYNDIQPLSSERYLTKTLFSFQRNNILWAIQAERQSRSHSFNIPKHLFREREYSYCLQHNVLECPCEITYSHIDFNIRGAILADESGLGKTISMLGLIQETCQDPLLRKEKHLCHHIFRQGKLKGQFCNHKLKQDSTFCQSHKNSFLLKHRSNIQSSSISLIVVDSNLIQQWLNKTLETCPNLSVICIRTRLEISCLTSEDISKAHIVILNDELIQASVHLFNQIHITRIIYDYPNPFIKHYTRPFLQAEFKWFLMGSFDKYDFNQLVEMIGDLHINESLDHLLYHQIYLHLKQTLIRNVRRNVYDSVKEVHRGPCHLLETRVPFNLKEEEVLYHRKERALYIPHLLKVCIHMNLYKYTPSLLPSHKTFDEIKTCILHNLEHCIKHAQNDTIKLRYTNKLVFIKSLEKEQECPICFEDNNKLCVFECGHSICKNCFNSLEKSHSCPICKSNVMRVYNVKSEVDEKSIEQYDIQDWIQELDSTKLGHLFHYLYHNQHKRIILYSRFHDVLVMLDELFKHYKFTCIDYTGHMYLREKSIQHFRTKSGIFTMSGCQFLSGIDLSCANTVIFLEPSPIDIESQVLSMVSRIGQENQIDIVRFIIKDTVDERVYDSRQS